MTDIQHYFDPVDFEKLNKTDNITTSKNLGFSIEKTTKSLNSNNFKRVKLAFFGIADPLDTLSSPDIIRSYLYGLSPISPILQIVDFGNLKPANTKKGGLLAVRDIVEYLSEQNITALIIGGTQEYTIGMCKPFVSQPFFTLTVIDSLLDVKKSRETLGSTNFLSHIFNEHSNLFEFNLLAYQSYYVSADLFSKINAVGRHLRLGDFREKSLDAEPILRDTHVLSFDLASIKYTDSPGCRNMNPNGLTSDEACQLAFYAGLSHQLKAFGLFEPFLLNDPHFITAKLSAQIIWYFIEGLANRNPTNNSGAKRRISYNVAVKNLETPLLFINDPVSNQWWMEITSINGIKTERSCTQSDYTQASNDEIPEIWLKYVQKMDHP
jgi:hypothetical protein